MTPKSSISKSGMKSLASRHQEHDWENSKECSLHNSTTQELQGHSVLCFWLWIFYLKVLNRAQKNWFESFRNFTLDRKLRKVLIAILLDVVVWRQLKKQSMIPDGHRWWLWWVAKKCSRKIRVKIVWHPLVVLLAEKVKNEQHLHIFRAFFWWARKNFKILVSLRAWFHDFIFFSLLYRTVRTPYDEPYELLWFICSHMTERDSETESTYLQRWENRKF